MNREVNVMKGRPGFFAAAVSMLIGLLAIQPASAQKSGGVLKISFFDNPASMSLHEEAAAAGIAVAARLGLVAGLSLPCAAARHAYAPDRHRAVQIRRIQTERGGPHGTKFGLLEAGPALSRRHRVGNHQGHRDAKPDL